MKKVNILIFTGFVLIISGLLLQLYQNNKEKQELIDVLAEQLDQCNKELNDLYGKNVKLEEINASLLDDYSINISSNNGGCYE